MNLSASGRLLVGLQALSTKVKISLDGVSLFWS